MGEQPAGVGVPQPLDARDGTVAEVCVWAVWISCAIGMLVMFAVVGGPGQDVAFDGHLPENCEGVSHCARCLE